MSISRNCIVGAHCLFALLLLAEAVSTFPSDKEALLALKASAFPNELATYWPAGDPCSDTWRGVNCSNEGRITVLNLTSLGLESHIPEDLGNLSELTLLSLAKNKLDGPIPASLGALSKLTRLLLGQNNLTGSIPSQLGGLPTLTVLALNENQLTGPIPPELCNITSLQQLDLRGNDLTGPIPSQIRQLSSLTFLVLMKNQLTGTLPDLSAMPNLTTLALSTNNLTGPIPASLSTLSRLTYLDLAHNRLTGPIPLALGQCQALDTLALSDNPLTGRIPPELGSLPKLRFLGLYGNNLTGPIPGELGQLPSLQFLSMNNNNFGSIPPELGNLTKLKYLELNDANLTGPIPEQLGSLSNLTNLLLFNNRLSGPIPALLGNLSSLTTMDLHNNSLTGSIPNDLQKLTKLTSLLLSSNQLNGSIPSALNLLLPLVTLDLSHNALSGRIPDALGILPQLANLNLSRNSLDGPIPPGLRFLRSLTSLDLSYNQLSEPIPADIAQLAKLTTLDLSANDITGSIPRELSSLVHLSRLSLSANKLNGEIPAELGTLKAVSSLSLSQNNLTGLIPADLAALPAMVDISQNNISGPIPRGFFWSPGSDLSGNFLVGSVPANLANSSVARNCLTLEDGDYISNGQRDHEACAQFYPGTPCSCPSPQVVGVDGLCNCVIPLQLTAVFTATDRMSFGNFTANLKETFRKLAAAASVTEKQATLVRYAPLSPSSLSVELIFNILPLARRSFPMDQRSAIVGRLSGPSNVTVPFFNPGFKLMLHVPSTSGNLTGSAIAVGVSVAALLFAALGTFLCWRGPHGKARRASRAILLRIPTTSVKSYQLSEIEKATNNFSDANKIGRGGFGDVYRANLGGILVAIKRLKVGSGQGWEEFQKELTTIGSIHNRNLVRILGYCATEKELLLVYEFMSNGSLHDAMFKEGRPVLGWEQCKRILVGTAQAIAYLHEGCAEKIIHRDIKPANILLDENFQAKVSDFGLARSTSIDDTHVSTAVVGTRGYLAPEYFDTNQLTEKSDIYSFGMVMLVVVAQSGLWSTQHGAAIGLRLRAFQLAREGRELEIMAPQFADVDRDEARRFILVMLLCIHPTAHLRPPMGKVVQMLQGDVEITPMSMPAVDAYIQMEHVSLSSEDLSSAST